MNFIEARSTPVPQKILDALDTGDKTIEELSKITGASDRTVRYWLYAMSSRNLVERYKDLRRDGRFTHFRKVPDASL